MRISNLYQTSSLKNVLSLSIANVLRNHKSPISNLRLAPEYLSYFGKGHGYSQMDIRFFRHDSRSLLQGPKSFEVAGRP